MTMSLIFKISMLVVAFSFSCAAQDPLPVVSATWQPTVRPARKTEPVGSIPARAMTSDDKYFQRTARDQRTDNPPSAGRDSIDARSAALEKAMQDAGAAKFDDTPGYTYTASVKNESGKTIEIVFWEYRFTEIAKPQNLVRHQFLCAMKLKKGDTKELSAFSQFGPSEVIDAASIAKQPGKLFNEEVIVNRIEFADGSILQRGDWKLADVKKNVDRVTSTPWAGEVCRKL
jgi:hypothetical protein